LIADALGRMRWDITVKAAYLSRIAWFFMGTGKRGGGKANAPRARGVQGFSGVSCCVVRHVGQLDGGGH
jgi:hypothetical protein